MSKKSYQDEVNRSRPNPLLIELMRAKIFGIRTRLVRDWSDQDLSLDYACQLITTLMEQNSLFRFAELLKGIEPRQHVNQVDEFTIGLGQISVVVFAEGQTLLVYVNYKAVG